MMHTNSYPRLLGLVLCLAALSGECMALTGTYRGDINGTPSTLTLEAQGQQLAGQIDAGGYVYQLQGQLVSADRAEGRFSDPQTGGGGNMNLQREGDRVNLAIEVPGQPQPLVLQFTAGSGPAAGGAVAQPAPAERDSSLVGHWLYTESYVSGEFSGASQWRLAIYPDGRYEYGDGQFAGGGPGVGGSSYGGDVEVGEWKTRDSVIYIKSPGSPQWQPYARYYVEGYSMMLTFGDGSRQVWKRGQ